MTNTTDKSSERSKQLINPVQIAIKAANNPDYREGLFDAVIFLKQPGIGLGQIEKLCNDIVTASSKSKSTFRNQ